MIWAEYLITHRGLRQEPLGTGEDGQEAEAVLSDSGAAEGRGRMDADADTVPRARG
jgi:hypothetical protein